MPALKEYAGAVTSFTGVHFGPCSPPRTHRYRITSRGTSAPRWSSCGWSWSRSPLW